MMVLWLLILRGISIEFRNHIDSPVWKPFWDAGFMALERAAGDLLRSGAGQRDPGSAARRLRAFLPAAVDGLRVGGELGILDWYTVLVGVLAFLALAQHGALWVALKTEERVQTPRAASGLRRPGSAWW